MQAARERINLHVYQSTFRHESRILKVTRSLANSGLFDRIVVIARWTEGMGEREELDTCRSVWRIRARSWGWGPLAKLTRTLSWSWGVLQAARSSGATCVSAHSLVVLPTCVILKWSLGAQLVYEPHELETEANGVRGMRKAIAKVLERTLIRFCDGVTTVNEPIAVWYRTHYRHPLVRSVRNVPVRRTGSAPRSGRLRAACGIPAEHLVFLYLGILEAGRGIELLVDAFGDVRADRHLVCVGFGSLTRLVQERGVGRTTIHYHPAVPPQQVVEFAAEADVGLALIENTSLSYYLSLPNKVFECLGAGVPVLVSDFPAMREVVDTYQCGWATEPDTERVRTLVNDLTPAAIQRARRGAERAADALSWENEEDVLLQVYRQSLRTRNRSGPDVPEGTPP